MEKTFSTEVFRVVKDIQRVTQPTYELSDMRNRPFEGQFCNYVFVNFTVSHSTEFQLDKLLRTRNKNGIKHLVKWRGYDKTFISWVNATDIK
jgi:hypothetical protein